jgi:subtilisin family serine protease
MVDAPGRRSGTGATLVAPGLDVLTLRPGAHYDFASGSSLAAAQASAVVALMLEANPRLRGDEVARLLSRTAHAVTSPSGRFVAINACAALVAVRQQGRCNGSGEANLARGP